MKTNMDLVDSDADDEKYKKSNFIQGDYVAKSKH